MGSVPSDYIHILLIKHSSECLPAKVLIATRPERHYLPPHKKILWVPGPQTDCTIMTSSLPCSQDNLAWNSPTDSPAKQGIHRRTGVSEILKSLLYQSKPEKVAWLWKSQGLYRSYPSHKSSVHGETLNLSRRHPNTSLDCLTPDLRLCSKLTFSVEHLPSQRREKPYPLQSLARISEVALQ